MLNGGEVAVSVMLEAITRLLPGFMGNPDSIVEESYTGGNALLEHHQYTKPATWRGIAVPPILTSGDHGKVDRFRRDEALTRTNDIRRISSSSSIAGSSTSRTARPSSPLAGRSPELVRASCSKSLGTRHQPLSPQKLSLTHSTFSLWVKSGNVKTEYR